MISLVTEYFLAIALFFSFITLIFYGFPVAWTMGGLGVLFIFISMISDNLFDTFYGVDFGFASMVVYRLYGVMANWVLVALPMFIFMGIMMDKSGIAEDLMTDLSKLFGKTRGGLAISIVFIGVLLAASTGIIGAVVTLMGLLAWPAMIRAGYDKKFASGVICSGGCLGILIPPSIMLIVYAVIAQLSPLRLFAAAIFPGLMLAGLYILYVIIRAYFNPSLAPRPAAEEIPPRAEILKEVLVSFVPLFSLIILVLGTILAGLATPAEAAAVGAFGALVLSYFYKSLKWKNFKESVFLTAKTSAMIMWLFVGSWTFASVFSYLGGHEVFETFFKSMDIQPWQFLVITQIIIFLLGWPLEWTEILIIFVPIFLPLVEFFGVNPYFFAMLIALNLQTSFLTPPMAMSAYYLKGVQSRNVELMQIFTGIMPFLAIVILAMVLMYIFPGIALWLPDVLFAE